MSESSNKLCNRYDVLAWGGAVLTLISLAVLPASSVSNLLAAVFAFMSVVGFLMMYMRENFIGSLLVLSGFFVVIFLFAMQSDNSELAGTAYLANFGSYYVKFRQPLDSTGTTYDLRFYDFVKAVEGSVFGEYAIVNFDKKYPASLGSCDRITARKLSLQDRAERALSYHAERGS